VVGNTESADKLPSGLVFAGLVRAGGKELLAVTAAQQEDEAVYVVTHVLDAVGGMWTDSSSDARESAGSGSAIGRGSEHLGEFGGSCLPEHNSVTLHRTSRAAPARHVSSMCSHEV
jgi:hypothetical protein